MAFENLFKRIKKFTGYEDFIKDKTRTFVRKNHLAAFQQIVAPFETQIPFHIVETMQDGNLRFLVEPIPNIEFTRTSSSGTSTTTRQLFVWLDEGTDTRYALMPDTFSNETQPNNLDTTHKSYNRGDIFVSRQHVDKPGLEARNWTRLINEQFSNDFSNATQATLIEFIKSRF